MTEKYVCINVPKIYKQHIDSLNSIPGIKIKNIHPLGATEYIAIFIPIAVVLYQTTPDIVKMIMEIIKLKDVSVVVDGYHLKGKPKEILEAIKLLPSLSEYLQNGGEFKPEGDALQVAKTVNLIEDYIKKESTQKMREDKESDGPESIENNER